MLHSQLSVRGRNHGWCDLVQLLTSHICYIAIVPICDMCKLYHIFTKPVFSFGRINADEAFRFGLVSSVVEPDQLMSHAVALAQKIALHSHPVVAKAKECVNMAEEVGLTSGLAYERYVGYVLSCKRIQAHFCASMLHQAMTIIVIDIRVDSSHVIVRILYSAGSDVCQRGSF